MNEIVPADPALYRLKSGAPPSLLGVRCRGCGGVFFPPQHYGCESCGAPAEALETVEMAGRGALHSFATVHLHQGKGIEAPFTVGVIVLDDGPAVRAILTGSSEGEFAAGDTMVATTAVRGRDDQGRETVELRFRKADEREAGGRR